MRWKRGIRRLRRKQKRDRAEEQSNIALARQLAAQAQSLFATGNSKQMTAVLLAVQSMQIKATGEAAQILRGIIRWQPCCQHKL
ncbi:MAG: hypothetical protein HS126_37240 [Anaerolineales bacterium]|nr:hypothetical protein [Anaerolineales bacterium]